MAALHPIQITDNSNEELNTDHKDFNSPINLEDHKSSKFDSNGAAAAFAEKRESRRD